MYLLGCYVTVDCLLQVKLYHTTSGLTQNRWLATVLRRVGADVVPYGSSANYRKIN